MEKVWMRVGGFVSAKPEQMALIMKGDVEALCDAIKDYGLELNGNSYIPVEDGEDIDFEI